MSAIPKYLPAARRSFFLYQPLILFCRKTLYGEGYSILHPQNNREYDRPLRRLLKQESSHAVGYGGFYEVKIYRVHGFNGILNGFFDDVS